MPSCRDVVALGLLLAGPLAAQDDDKDLLERFQLLMNRPVDSTTKTAHLVSEAPGIVTVITTEEIEESGAGTLADLLKRVPGIQIGDNRANVLMVWIRGVTTTYNEKVLLLIDGVPKRDVIQSEWAPDERLDLQNIERIEVIRGPGSALYGGNAYAGVISIYSKKRPAPTTFQATAGSLGTGQLAFRGGGNAGELNLTFAANTFKTDGWASERGLDGRPTDNTNARAARDLQAHAGYGEHWTVDLVFGAFDYRYPMHPLGDRRDANYTYTLGSIGHTAQLGPATFTNKVYADNTKLHFYEVVEYPDNSLKRNKEQTKQGLVLGFNSQCAWKASDHHELLLGLNFERNRATYLEEEWNPGSTDPNHPPHFYNSWFSQHGEGPGVNVAGTSNYALFAQDEARFFDHRLGATLGLRSDHFDGFGAQISPRVGLVFTPQESTTVKALWGRAFRPPTFRQLYVVRFDTLQPGDPTLRPEKAETLEMEWGQKLGAISYCRLGYFHSKLTDTTLTIGDNPWANLDVPRITAGLELELRTELQLNGPVLRSLSLFLGGSHLLKAYDDTPLGPVDIASVAPNLVNLGITARTARLSLFTAWNLVGRRNPGYAYDPVKKAIVYTYHAGVADAFADYRARDNKGGYVTQDLNLAWQGFSSLPLKLELIVRNLWDRLHYNPTHDPDKFYDVVMERRTLLLRLGGRF